MDVTKEVRGQHSGMSAIDVLNVVIDNADVGLYASDYDTGDIIFANKKFAMLAGSSVEELMGRKCWEIANYSGIGRCPFCPHQKLLDDEGKPTGRHTWELYLPPSDLWLKCINEAVPWVDGRLAHIVTFFDITETKKMQAQLTGLAFVDQRLQLKNGLRLERDLSEAERAPSLIVFDILSLRKINEAYGREAGDYLLLSVRDWVRGLNIPNSELYRIGGDEFCLTVEEVTGEALNAIGDKIHRRFRESWVFESVADKPNVFCNASIAIIHSEYIQENEPLLNMIERTLQAAKNNTKVTVYNKVMDKDFKKRIQLELSLKKSVRDDMAGFDVYYQPIADPVGGIWCGLEALCRWNSPELGTVSPQMFIPEAERLELIGTIGLWVLETAVSTCKKWELDKHRKFILDVNLSAVQFLDEMLAPKILNALEVNDYPGEKLSIEITESTQFTFTDQSLKTIEQLRARGVLVALDDFGTGYSSFNNLESLPVDILKIERVFITDIETDSYQQYLFRVMAELAHAVNMTLIAEGVENREQMDILLKNGADLLQGYLFSKPLPAWQLETQLNHFYELDETFNVVRGRKIDINRLLDIENSYILTPNHYKILNQCMHILFHHTDVKTAVERILEIVGNHLDVSRAYVITRNEDNTFTEVYEWCAEDISSRKSSLSRISISDDWLRVLKNDGVAMSIDPAMLPYDTANAGDQKAIVALPLLEGEVLIGFTGFDDCHFFRDWRPEEILMLYNLCVIITDILKMQKLQDEINRIEISGFRSDRES